MEETKKRLETAVKFLMDKLPFKVGDIYLGIDERDFLNITVASRSSALGNITKLSAQEELEDGKRLFNEMIRVSNEFRLFTIKQKIKFNLDFDYGMGDLRICSEIDGIIYWHYDVKMS
ncbi:MAG: hypothetical protein WCO43_10575 [Chitinophagia bacterium]